MLRWDDINVRNSFGIYLSSVPLNFAGLPKLYTHFPLEYKSEILFLVFRRSGSNHLIIYFKMREIATNLEEDSESWALIRAYSETSRVRWRGYVASGSYSAEHHAYPSRVLPKVKDCLEGALDLIPKSSEQFLGLNLLEFSVACNILDYALCWKCFPSFSSSPFPGLPPISLITPFQYFPFSALLKHSKFLTSHP